MRWAGAFLRFRREGQTGLANGIRIGQFGQFLQALGTGAVSSCQGSGPGAMRAGRVTQSVSSRERVAVDRWVCRGKAPRTQALSPGQGLGAKSRSHVVPDKARGFQGGRGCPSPLTVLTWPRGTLCHSSNAPSSSCPRAFAPAVCCTCEVLPGFADFVLASGQRSRVSPIASPAGAPVARGPSFPWLCS